MARGPRQTGWQALGAWLQRRWKTVLAVVGLAVLVLVICAYIFQWTWTGFSGYKGNTTIPRVQTLWDWLQLLVIPIAVAGVGVLFNWRRDQTEHQLEEDRQREEALAAYLDKMSELLLDEKTQDSGLGTKTQIIVQALTVTALRRLDKSRRGAVLDFLRAAGSDGTVLRGANLSEADLEEANLHEADLSGANLYKADLRKARLSGANLHEADLSGANLGEANLHEADLSRANLYKTDLRKARLSGANLGEANLSEADLGEANLSEADLSGANLHEANLYKADLSQANLNRAHLWKANLSQATLSGANLSAPTFLGEADLSEADLSGAIISPKQLEEAKNITPEQLAQIKSLQPMATQEAKTGQTFTTPLPLDIKPDQTSQEEAEKKEHKQPKQDTDASC